MRRLTGAAAAEVDPASLVEPELVRYPRRDGGAVPGYLYRPRRPAGGAGRCPVVISAHGGPVWQERPVYLHDGFYQYLVSRGIAVLAPNVRGSSGYGRAYQQHVYRDWGGVDLDDFTDAARYLRGQSWVDPTRIGLFGRSYGGFMVLSLLSRRPELDWAAGVDVCGPSNLTTLARDAPPTWRSLVLAMFGELDENEEFLLSRSPFTHADRIRAPLFVIQGANDPRVRRHESDQIVELLRRRGVEVRYDVYPDEGHAFTRSENRVKSHEDAAEFLIEQLTRR